MDVTGIEWAYEPTGPLQREERYELLILYLLERNEEHALEHQKRFREFGTSDTIMGLPLGGRGERTCSNWEEEAMESCFSALFEAEQCNLLWGADTAHDAHRLR